MSGKTARRLRRLTEQAMNAQHGSTTIRPHEDDRAYKKVPVLANRKKDLSYASSNTTEVIKVDQKNPRAFYQQAKKMYKSGEAQREADRIALHLIDQPLNASTRLRIYAATAIALQRWEKRIRLRRVQLIPSADGRAELQLELQRTDMPRRPTVTIAYPLSSFGA